MIPESSDEEAKEEVEPQSIAKAVPKSPAKPEEITVEPVKPPPKRRGRPPKSATAAKQVSVPKSPVKVCSRAFKLPSPPVFTVWSALGS